MHTSKQLLILALLVVLLIAFVPLAPRIPLVPCHYMWRHAISYGVPGGTTLVPLDRFPHFPPRCQDLVPGYFSWI
jgi:hypothetical protein